MWVMTGSLAAISEAVQLRVLQSDKKWVGPGCRVVAPICEERSEPLVMEGTSIKP